MNQKVWGPGTWLLLHSISFNYTTKKRKEVENFLYSLNEVLPCRYCRESMTKHIKKYPPNLNSRREFVAWMIDFHNLVNVSLDKPVVPFDEAIAIYEKLYNKKLKLDEEKEDNNFDDYDISTLFNEIKKQLNKKNFILLSIIVLSIGLLYTLNEGRNRKGYGKGRIRKK
jgi:hypothetical protein